MKPSSVSPESDLGLAIAAALKGAALGLDYFERVASLNQEGGRVAGDRS